MNLISYLPDLIFVIPGKEVFLDLFYQTFCFVLFFNFCPRDGDEWL